MLPAAPLGVVLRAPSLAVCCFWLGSFTSSWLSGITSARAQLRARPAAREGSGQPARPAGNSKLFDLAWLYLKKLHKLLQIKSNCEIFQSNAFLV